MTGRSRHPHTSYTNDWFAACFSHELKPGKVRNVPFMGRELVLYRTRSGLARAISPHCPHLGAHLGHGGRVDGENIVCPFHAFAFGPDGQCVRTGYGVPPPRARLTNWPTYEANGAVFVWHHHENRPPTWEVPTASTEGLSGLSHHTSVSGGSMQDLVENSLDIGHYQPLHDWRNAQVTHVEFDGPRMKLGVSLSYHGAVDVGYDFVAHGLGLILVSATVPRFGVVAAVIGRPTQIAPDQWKLRTSTAVGIPEKKWLPKAARRIAQRSLAELMSRFFTERESNKDVTIWSHRKFIDHPKLVPGDVPIMAFRRWTAQFYPVDRPDDASNRHTAFGGEELQFAHPAEE